MNRYLVLLCLLLSPAAWAGRYALVIANQTYTESGSSLRTPIADATKVEKLLKELGFTSERVEKNLTKAELDAVVERFGARLTAGDEAIVFYAGHGMEILGENYLIPTDFNAKTETNARFQAYPLAQLLGNLESAGSKIVMVDACRDAPFARSWTRKAGGGRGFAAVSAAQGSLVVFSAGSGETASDGDGQSPFAAALLSELAACDDFRLVMTDIRTAVSDMTDNRQTPAVYDQLRGRYRLNPRCDERRLEPVPAPIPARRPTPAPTPTPAPVARGLDRTETTVADYRRCVQAGGCSATRVDSISYCNWSHSDRGDHPMNCVDWTQADAYCRWSGGRLPTEQEWERAATNGGTTSEPWGSGEATCSVAVMENSGNDGCGQDRTWPVCSRPAGNTQSGLCDLVGNVWEWTSTESGSLRVRRGGGWNDGASLARASARGVRTPSYRDRHLGFRCLRD